jgi:translation initiation factor 2 subunit 1
MLYLKTGIPAEDDILLCTVTNVQYNSVFCSLDEYTGLSGMIHISEVTAGRIRNIREYVQEGRKVVCKVLRVDEAKGHIDLSLRRVTEGQRRQKTAAVKQEMKAENLLTHVAKEIKTDLKELYPPVMDAIADRYEYLHQAFEAIVDDQFSFTSTKLDAKIAKRLDEIVKERIKPTSVAVEGVLHLSTFAQSGVQKVREALVAGRDAAKADVRYLGAGSWKISVTAEEYKDAEKRLKAGVDAVEKAFKKVGDVSFERVETAKE